MNSKIFQVGFTSIDQFSTHGGENRRGVNREVAGRVHPVLPGRKER
jgi:hypothetical protein